ncbi:pyridoxal phosphate-dependent transferase [Chaetomidium leptoderma]|uniref:Pyridoxal phosphate-dependent transferase n=1 Tax=Chaetomidium leptoderma TaxID=669021 RepID=A0AAN6ZXN7_9PEZI|nr:pyridoxal phosphate-dependent transferase [Chaetomidium leptoderma]
MAASLDMDEVRGSFPALAGEQVYLDNAGGSQALGAVAERIRDYLLNTNVQLGATYSTGKKSTDRYNEGYAAAAKYIGASRDEIVLGPSTTQLFRNVSYALRFQEGDELIVSVVDHEANIAPWVDLAERQKLVLKWWKPNSDTPDAKTNPKLLASDLADLLTDKTRLVTCTHASNILGTIHDIKAITSTVHSHNPNALVCVDAVAYAPHRKIDVKDLGVDFYSFSWYKVYGPHISLLYASPLALSQLHSLGHFFNPHTTLEHKLGLAAASYELVHALPAVVSYLNNGDDDDDNNDGGGKWPAIVAHETTLQTTLLNWLDSRGADDVVVYGERSADARARVPTVSFGVRGWGARELVEAVEADADAEEGAVFGFRWGAFYSVRLVEDVLGLSSSSSGDGVVRVSMVHYNTVDEVKGLIAVLEKVLAAGRK